MSNELKLITGSAYPEFAQAVAKVLGVELTPVHTETFLGGEDYVRIEESLAGSDLYVIQSGVTPAYRSFMELVTLVSAARNSAWRITAVEPYMPYLRADRKDRSRTAVMSAATVAMAVAAGVDGFLTVDPHFDQAGNAAYTLRRDFNTLYAAKAVLARLRADYRGRALIIASPDRGGERRADYYADKLDDAGVTVLSKDRLSGTRTRVKNVYGANVRGRTVIVVDDLTSTGSSLVNTAATLKRLGAASVAAVVTHLVTEEAARRLQESPVVDRCYTTDTLPVPAGYNKISVVSVVPLVAAAILRLHTGRSLTDLFV